MSTQIIVAFSIIFIAHKLVLWLTGRSQVLRDVPGPEKEHWLKGNYHRIFNKTGWDYNIQLMEKYGGAVKIHGILGARQLYVSDPRALYHIVVKDQDIFEETDMFIMGNKLIFGEGLISTLGDQHRKQRKILNPVFSLSNMRDLLPTIQPIADELVKVLRSQVSSTEQEVNMMEWMSRAAFEYICQAGLGYTFSALDPNQTNEFTEAVKLLSPTAFGLVLVRPLVPFAIRTIPLSWRVKMIEWLPIKSLKEMRRIVGIMDKTSRTIYSAKLTNLKYSGSGGFTNGEGNLGFRNNGKDIMSILLKANTSALETERLTEEELLGQMNTLIFAAFETSTSALSRILHILAERPEVQERLRKEIVEAKDKAANYAELDAKDVRLSYDVLMSLPYLDAVCRETLRMYPPVLLLGRTARKSTVLPLDFPMRNAAGQEITSIPVPANTNVTISILAANRNKRVWGEDADEWKPERWLTTDGKIKTGIYEGDLSGDHSGTGPRYPGVYASMMTFLGGGRGCIGFKFAEMEIKQVLATVLPALRFSLPNKRIYWNMAGIQTPVILEPEGDGSTPQLPLKVELV